MERLLIQRFLGEHPDLSDKYIHELLLYNEYGGEESNCETVLAIWDFYKSFKQKIRNGSLGKKAQFWMIYLDMMQKQQELHTAIQENNFQGILCSWDYFLSFHFATNKHNYARFWKLTFSSHEKLRKLLSRFEGKSISTSTRPIPFTYCSGPERRADS